MDLYSYVKAFHVISIIAWMAGMLYLPRLYVYHVGAAPGSELSETLKVMEGRLLRFIMTPALIASWVSGLWLIFGFEIIDLRTAGWLHAKLTAVFLLSGVHGMFAAWRRAFAEDRNTKSAGFYRVLNEVPTVLMVFVVIMVIVKPF